MVIDSCARPDPLPSPPQPVDPPHGLLEALEVPDVPLEDVEVGPVEAEQVLGALQLAHEGPHVEPLAQQVRRHPLTRLARRP